jgi:DNA-binding NarL/FixJ family response regulator
VIPVADRLRAYLVDDEPLALTRLARLLAATGRVELVGQALSPDGALAALTEGAADVVFLDINMPGMSGLALAERLPRDLAVVFTTAYDQHALAAFDANAVDYLLKPVEAERLTRALNKLERRRDEPSRGDMAEALLRLATALRAAPAPFLDRVPFRTPRRRTVRRDQAGDTLHRPQPPHARGDGDGRARRRLRAGRSRGEARSRQVRPHSPRGAAESRFRGGGSAVAGRPAAGAAQGRPAHEPRGGPRPRQSA